jgi:excisionase family DNA binding protein
MQDLLTAEEVATYFRVAPTTVTRWARQGVIESVHIEGIKRRLFRRADVEAMLERPSEVAS